jgi:O-antigen/teichoic acid export membrane protein
MGQSLVAHLAADPSGLSAAVRSMIVKSLTLLVPAVVVIAPGAYLVMLVFGREYAETGAVLLALLALSAIPNVITQSAVWAARVQRRGAVQVVVPATLAVLVVAGTCVLVPILGVTAAGVAWLGAQIVVAVGVLIDRQIRRSRSNPTSGTVVG